jgi:hypothetical protein
VHAELHENAQLTGNPPLAFGWIAIGLDDKEQTFAWLEKAYTNRHPSLPLLDADSVYDGLRADRGSPL